MKIARAMVSLAAAAVLTLPGAAAAQDEPPEAPRREYIAPLSQQTHSNPGGSNPEAALWVPGIGPFIQMPGTSTATGTWLLAVDGLVQTAGLAMLVYGSRRQGPCSFATTLASALRPGRWRWGATAGV